MKKLKFDTNKELVDYLDEKLKPLDVLNLYYFPIRDIKSFFRNWYVNIVAFFISSEAKSFFGKKGYCKHFHTELFCNKNKILNIISPRVRWDSTNFLVDFNFTVYRYNAYEFKQSDSDFVIDYAEKQNFYERSDGSEFNLRLIDSKYNAGALFDFLLNSFTGNRLYQKHRIFSKRDGMVCSTGCTHMFKKALNNIDPNLKKSFFSKLNRDKFIRSSPASKQILNEYDLFKKIDANSVRPAFYSNTNFFNNEFIKVIEVKNRTVTEYI